MGTYEPIAAGARANCADGRNAWRSESSIGTDSNSGAKQKRLFF